MSTTTREIARLTSFEDCIVTGCRLENGHEGRHDFSTPEIAPLQPDADIDPALYGLPQDSEKTPAGWDVAEPGPEQVPQHLRGHVAALSLTYWTQLSKLPGDANSGTRANEYETLVALGVAERKVEPLYFNNGQPRGSRLFFRLAEPEARP